MIVKTYPLLKTMVLIVIIITIVYYVFVTICKTKIPINNNTKFRLKIT